MRSVQLFAAGLQTFVGIVGPSGWGKSHLLEAVARQLRYEFGHAHCTVQSAAEYANNVGRLDPHVPLVLDNVQDVLAKPKLRQQLRLHLERRVKTGRPTLLSFTSSRVTRQIRGLLPSGREWFVSAIGQPDPKERELVVQHMAKLEQLRLSPNLMCLMAHKLKGNGHTLKGALKRLKLHQRTWLSPRETLKACGVLNPFFADNSGWDLREVVAETAGAMPRMEDPRAYAIYLLANEAMLSEADVAKFFDVEPAAVYGVSSTMRLRNNSDVALSQALDALTERVVERLLSE